MRPSQRLPAGTTPWAASATAAALPRPEDQPTGSPRSRWYRCGAALLVSAAAAGCTSIAQEPEVAQAWVQAAHEGQWVARALTDAASCPILRWLNGHVHLFEALGFATSHPATVVLGNSGSAMEGFIAEAAALRAQPAPGAVVQSFATHPGFGFASLDRSPTGWSLTAWSVAGQALKRCDIEGQRLHCAP